jgi:hypothetical protein
MDPKTWADSGAMLHATAAKQWAVFAAGFRALQTRVG